jgi:hypothetical protein
MRAVVLKVDFWVAKEEDAERREEKWDAYIVKYQVGRILLHSCAGR